MDSLALLCNLHGDGPATLAGLRKLGCFDLSAVLLVDADALTSLFEENQKRSSRFGREARLLADRLGETMEEQTVETSLDDYATNPDVEEFAPGPESTAPETLTPFPVLSKVDTASAALLGTESPAEPMGPEHEARVERTAPKGVVVNAVLDLWSRLDGREPPANYTANCHLLDAPIEGISKEAAAQLCEIGIETLEDLVEADILGLVTQSGIPFTKLAHLQFLARKALGTSSRAEPATMLRPEPAPSPAGPELTPFWRGEQVAAELEAKPEPVEDGPAGPFA